MPLMFEKPGKTKYTNAGYLFLFMYIISGSFLLTVYTSWYKMMIAQVTDIYVHYWAVWVNCRSIAEHKTAVPPFLTHCIKYGLVLSHGNKVIGLFDTSGITKNNPMPYTHYFRKHYHAMTKHIFFPQNFISHHSYIHIHFDSTLST